ncbi:MAG: hypothetical protein CO118_01785 [Flavobacteriales bacterium CG_4_9_14_3_um_filter_32_8]|nr:MAG: hypothetical protein CO118_01785 [Flavobacteriales bacterium CG_4_9_14_3_um_filter_32_8]
MLLLATISLNAQNIGINATGAVPAASAGLDVDFTNKGFLAPRVALTALNAAGPIAAPATSLLVYNTATAGVSPNNVTPGYYYWGGAAWVRFSTGGDDWKITGNANTVAGTNFLGTTNAQALNFRTSNLTRFTVANAYQVFAENNGTAALPFYSRSADPNTGMYFIGADILGFSTTGVERMRITNIGQVGVNTPAPAAGDLVSATSAAGKEWAINGYNALAMGSGVYAQTTNASNTYSAIEGSQSGAAAGGGGVYGIGNVLGTIGKANSITLQAFGVQGDNDGIWAALGGWQSGPWTARKVYGLGTVSTIIDGLNEGEKVTMSAPESPDILFMDFGTGQLNNGIIHVTIDPIFTKNIHVDAEHPIKIFVQLEGECNGVYVANKSASGFDVIELNGGTSNVSFSYSITANRANEVFTYSDGTTKVSDNINSRYHPVDLSFFKEQSSREGHKGRSLIKSRSLQMNNDGK